MKEGLDMRRSTKLTTETQLELPQVARFKNLKPKDGLPIFRFEKTGDAIAARFLRRRDGIRTKLDNDARAVDVEIIESSDELTRGEHTIFLSTHLKKIFDEYQLSPGDRFVLKLCSVDEDNGFKRFACELIDQHGQPPEHGDIPFPSDE